MRCQWFALCDNEAIGTSPVPWGDVPICQRCADTVGAPVTKFEEEGTS